MYISQYPRRIIKDIRAKIKTTELKKALLIETKESNIRNTKTGINAAKRNIQNLKKNIIASQIMISYIRK